MPDEYEWRPPRLRSINHLAKPWHHSQTRGYSQFANDGDSADRLSRAGHDLAQHDHTLDRGGWHGENIPSYEDGYCRGHGRRISRATMPTGRSALSRLRKPELRHSRSAGLDDGGDCRSESPCLGD